MMGIPAKNNNNLPTLSGNTTSTPLSREGAIDVRGLIEDIFRLPPEDIPGQIERVGMEIEIIQCDASFSVPLGSPSEELLSTDRIPRISSEFDALVRFSRALSLHTSTRENTNTEHQKYRELLYRLRPLLAPSFDSRMRDLLFFPESSRLMRLASLEKAGLLPEQVIREIFELQRENGKSEYIASQLAYSGIRDSSSMFQELTQHGGVIPQSEKEDITSEEYLLFVREALGRSLEYLWNYLRFQSVWQFMQREYGENVMRSFFNEYEALESGYTLRIEKRDFSTLSQKDFTLFYELYISIENRLKDLRITPENIELQSLKKSI